MLFPLDKFIFLVCLLFGTGLHQNTSKHVLMVELGHKMGMERGGRLFA